MTMIILLREPISAIRFVIYNTSSGSDEGAVPRAIREDNIPSWRTIEKAGYVLIK